jgi:hypothetical protein
VVKRVYPGVVVLADVAGTGLQQRSRGGGLGAGSQGDSAGFVIDAIGGTGGGGRDDVLVGLRDDGALLEPAVLFDRLEHTCRCPADRDEIGVFFVEFVHLLEHTQGDRQSVRVYPDRLGCSVGFPVSHNRL